MSKFEPQFFKIGDKLLAYKNRLFEVVQYKLDEGKDKNQIIKELKDEFEPTIDVMKEIECKFFKEADIRKTPGKREWKVLTEKGKPMGTYDSPEDAKTRLQQMEMFKHMKGDIEIEGQDLSKSQVGDDIVVGDEVGEVITNTDTLIQIRLPDGQIKEIPKIK